MIEGKNGDAFFIFALVIAGVIGALILVVIIICIVKCARRNKNQTTPVTNINNMNRVPTSEPYNSYGPSFGHPDEYS